MAKLPKNFPEYSLMYKNLNKKIQKLKDELTRHKDKESKQKIQDEINKYQKESERIKSLFPENFFENN